MEVKHGAVNVVEELSVVLDGGTAAEKDNDLLLLGVHLAQEREEQDEASIGIAQDIALLQTIHGTKLLLLVDIDIQGSGAQRNSGEVLNLCRLCSREEHSLAVVIGENLDNLTNLVLETDLENAVRLVNDERLEILEDKRRVEEVIEQTARGGNQQVDALGQLLGLGLAVGAAHDDSVCLRVVLHQLAGDAKDLQRQLARRGDDNDAGSVARLEAEAVEDFDGRDEEGQRLTGAGLGGTEHVLACEEGRNGLWRQSGLESVFYTKSQPLGEACNLRFFECSSSW